MEVTLTMVAMIWVMEVVEDLAMPLLSHGVTLTCTSCSPIMASPFRPGEQEGNKHL